MNEKSSRPLSFGTFPPPANTTSPPTTTHNPTNSHNAPPRDAYIDDSDTPAYTQTRLPNTSFQGLWQSLELPEGAKERLLAYADSALEFAAAGVDTNLISVNRVVLLHGPPGTGKTSAAKGLAQMLASRSSSSSPSSMIDGGEAQVFIEINAHALFSKWFSESGKLVLKLFTALKEVAANTKLLVVLLDEVESLTSARSAALAGGEPSDGIRAVNSVLTQLDSLKSFPNVFVIATSNVTGAIDGAFVDRADLKLYFGPPPQEAIYRILVGLLLELSRVGWVLDSMDPAQIPSVAEVRANEQLGQMGQWNDLWTIARLAQGLSGRTLRKIPLLARAAGFVGSPPTTLKAWIDGLGSAVALEQETRSAMET